MKLNKDIFRKLSLLIIVIWSNITLSQTHSIIKSKPIAQPLGNTNAISGRILNAIGIPIPATTLIVNGTKTNISNNYGNYFCTLPNGINYTIKPQKLDADSVRTNGVSAIDVILTQSHILNKLPFTSPYQFIAADVNNDGVISTIDMLFMKRFILGLDTAFKGNRTWAFVDSAYQFPNLNYPFSYKDSISFNPLAVNNINQSFKGIKLGDVNFDWQPNYILNSNPDTLRVITYNVLKYGDGCQGTTAQLNGYLKTIVQYANPDILGLVKVGAFTPSATTTSTNFALNINDLVLNDMFPSKYDFAAPTNASGADNLAVLFFNTQKLGWIQSQTIVNNVTDFNLYKLYYKDDNLIYTHDTTFLYVMLNHTQSGNSSTIRDQQITQEMQALRAKFTSFPNLINMGDFNTRNSSEVCYQQITNNTDTATKMYDPPFAIDKKVQYPADWDINPQNFKNYLTTSTRLSSSIPNKCGTNGGAKSWYDHIFLSSNLVNGTDFIQYVPNSYKTIGNDGNRVGVDINSTSPIANTSVPANVVDALFQFSNKYPVMVQLKVNMNTGK